MANNYYSLRSYDHFCFFCQINNSKKKKDEFVFFVFFTFKGWKRLLVADGPRQVINAFTLYVFASRVHFSSDVSDYYQGNYFTAIMLLAMMFTVLVFAASFLMLIIAALMYIPLVIYIKGNLKEYACHKIDKRISELVRYKKKMRLAKQAAIARAEANGDFSHLKNKKGEIVGKAIPQPTLPTVDIDLFNHKDNGSIKKRNSTESYAEKQAAGGGGFGESPGFGPQRFMGGNGNGSIYGRESPSLYHGNGNEDEHGSNAHLILNAGPAGGNGSSNMDHNNYGYQTPSIPPSTHTSPESYPNHIRGINGQAGQVQRSISPNLQMNGLNSSSSNNLLDSLGPIGTSPQVRPMQVRGLLEKQKLQQQQQRQGGGGMNNNVSNEKSPLGMSVQNSPDLNGMSPGYADYSGGGYDDYSNGNGYDYNYNDPSANGNGNYDYNYSDPSYQNQNQNQDLSSYVPYSDNGNQYLNPNPASAVRNNSNRSDRDAAFGLSEVIDDYYDEDGNLSRDNSRSASRNDNGGYDYDYNYSSNNAGSGGYNDQNYNYNYSNDPNNYQYQFGSNSIGNGNENESSYDEIESYNWGERNQPVAYQMENQGMRKNLNVNQNQHQPQTWDDPLPTKSNGGVELKDDSASIVKETTVRGARRR